MLHALTLTQQYMLTALTPEINKNTHQLGNFYMLLHLVNTILKRN